MLIRSSIGLAVVVMVVDGVVGRGGRSGKVGWVIIGVGEGGVGVRGRVRLAESRCERSRLLSRSSCGWMLTSGSRNRGSSSEVGDSEVESTGSLVLRSPQWGFTGGGRWEMVVAYSMVAVDITLVFCYTQPG